MDDIVITGGLVIDGTGQPGRVADVAVCDGVITRVSDAGTTGAGTRAHRVIEADGAIVTPGFVDIHTHYDGQATWDDALEPSASHGITTVVTGNCGVGFAPVMPSHHDALIELMEGVEDIPGTALHEGIDWRWETFPEYLDLLATKKWSMDVGTQIAHGALRTYVMGQRGIANEAANPDDIAQMSQLTAQALAAGALGFSTSRILGHQSVGGEPVPGTFAHRDEVLAIGRAMQPYGAVYELVPGGSIGQGGLTLGEGEALLHQELEWMAQLSRETGLPITFLIVEFGEDPDAWRAAMDFVVEANAQGAQLFPQTASRPAGVLLSWESKHLFKRRPSYVAIEELPLQARLAELRRPEVRRAILEETNLPPASESVNDVMHVMIANNLENVFPLGLPLNYEPGPEDSVAAGARRAGIPVEAAMYDQMLEHDGAAILMMPVLGFARGNCDAIYDMLADAHSVVGLADGGAHCGLICDASSTTHLLTHWVRDRPGPRLGLEYVIKKQCADTASLYGLGDRGVIEPGKRADINVIDFDNLSLGMPYVSHDLPAGGKRFLQPASGYWATLVAGEVVRDHDGDTGARPGRLVRGRRQDHDRGDNARTPQSRGNPSARRHLA
ncbi:MAG: amidohydrolase family protein [Acidimicrobiales bacterium]